MSESERKVKPPVKNSGSAAGVVIFLVIIVLLGVGGYFYFHRGAAKVDAAGGRNGNFPVAVITGRVKQKDVPIYLNGLGTVQAFNTVTIKPRVDGQLVQVAFTEGQEVKVGDLLAQIDPAPYQAVLDQTTAKKAQDAALLANAQADLQRYADLLKSAGTTQQTFDTQKSLVDQLEAAVKADQAAMDSAKVNLDYTTIRSPLNGRTGIRLVDQGNLVHASDPGGLVVLTQVKPISIVFTLPETALAELSASQTLDKADFPVLALARDNTNIVATGQLAVIDNQIDTTTGTIKLKATFANDDLRLWPGEFINTRLLLATRHDSPVVPASTVQRGPDGTFVYVVAAAEDNPTNRIVHMRPIKVAQIDNDEALIDSGLEPGEIVVVDGQYKLQEGSKVRPTSATGAAGGSGGAHKTHPDNSDTNQVTTP